MILESEQVFDKFLVEKGHYFVKNRNSTTLAKVSNQFLK